jgi:hypothetical protein
MMLTLRLLAVYFGTAVLCIVLLRRWIAAVSLPAAAFLAVAPFVLVGRAMLTASVYAPLEIAYQTPPLASSAALYGMTRPSTPALGDVTSNALPMRKAVREAVKHGRVPLWNSFDMAGSPLLAAQQPAVLHPGTWIGFLLPLAQAWTFEMAFRIFLALAAAYLYFRDLDIHDFAALFGAAAWAFCDFLVFWRGYAVGTAISVFPLLLLGLRRLARDADRRGVLTTVVALLLITLAGHPEAILHSVCGAGVYFLFELAWAPASRRGKAIGLSFVSGALTLGLSAVVLLPFAEVLPFTAEWVGRVGALSEPHHGISALENLRWSARTLLPYAFGVSGHGKLAGYFGLPAAYGGALLFPLAVVGLASKRRERWAYLGLLVIGLAIWAQLFGVMSLAASLPLIRLTLVHYFVFLGAFGLVAVAVLGLDRIARGEARGAFLLAAAVTLASIAACFALIRPELLSLEMQPGDLTRRLLLQLAPLALSALALLLLPPARAATALIALLLCARGLEAAEVYPTHAARGFFPMPDVFSGLARGGGYRIVGIRDALIPNLSTFYELEDVRGYEALVLATQRETFPLWCAEQPAWFNRVDDASRPFLSFLAVRYAVGGPAEPVPAGWKTVARTEGASLFESPRFLPKAFVPATYMRLASPQAQRAALGKIEDFAMAGVLEDLGGQDDAAAATPTANGAASVEIVSNAGQSLELHVDAQAEALVATSLPRWPGWRVAVDGRRVPGLSYNRAFLAFRVPPGRHAVKLWYLPDGFLLGLCVSAATLLGVVLSRRRAPR